MECVLRTDNPVVRILWAAETGNIDVVIEMLNKDAYLITATDADGYSPLHRASYEGHSHVVEVCDSLHIENLLFICQSYCILITRTADIISSKTKWEQKFSVLNVTIVTKLFISEWRNLSAINSCASHIFQPVMVLTDSFLQMFEKCCEFFFVWNAVTQLVHQVPVSPLMGKTVLWFLGHFLKESNKFFVNYVWSCLVF